MQIRDFSSFIHFPAVRSDIAFPLRRPVLPPTQAGQARSIIASRERNPTGNLEKGIPRILLRGLCALNPYWTAFLRRFHVEDKQKPFYRYGSGAAIPIAAAISRRSRNARKEITNVSNMLFTGCKDRKGPEMGAVGGLASPWRSYSGRCRDGPVVP